MADDDASDHPTTAAEPGSAAAVDGRLIAQELFGPAYESISRYRDILAGRGIKWGLLGPREVDRLWTRHILNCIAVADLIPQGATIADVGSGAGLPGIPVVILRPDLTVDLIEPLLRRSNFLTHSVDELGITARARVRRERAEDVRQRYAVVMSRALAPLDRLIGWCLPLLSTDGQILAIKGESAPEELKRHRKLVATSGLAAEIVRLRCDPRVEMTTVVRLVRN